MARPDHAKACKVRECRAPAVTNSRAPVATSKVHRALVGTSSKAHRALVRRALVATSSKALAATSKVHRALEYRALVATSRVHRATSRPHSR